MIWKSKAGKKLPIAVARELIKTGRTEKQVTGFKGRSGKSFRAKLALQQADDGKWRVEFDEPWAKEGAKPPEQEEAATASAAEDAGSRGALPAAQRSSAGHRLASVPPGRPASRRPPPAPSADAAHARPRPRELRQGRRGARRVRARRPRGAAARRADGG